MFKSNDQKTALAELLRETDTMEIAETPCSNYPDAFFPEVGQGGDSQATQFARSACASCPIVASCADYGIKYERYGFWGGLSPRERSEIRRLRGISEPDDLAA